MAPRLKVFVTSDGLTDYVVAVSSRAKALAAWGVRQDLFKEGKARETDEASLREAALAAPGQVLRRPSAGRGTLEKLKPASKPKPKTPSKAALKKLADLETKLASTRAALSKAERRLEAARAELQTAEETAATLRAARDQVDADLADAREALDR